ncbi:hypothetical protein [Massilia timonae]|uniref:hypothetical protein n=1 Tax=Massilia timonae TaxID=47229 RepID=UPI0023520394|nr:hypothetical protein [Massilia timonae]
MKNILLTLVLLSSNSFAQTLECPSKSGKDKLHDASAYFDDKISEIQGGFIEKKNGYDLTLPLNVKYLACDYKNNKKVWKEFTPEKEVKNCTMEVREKTNGNKTAKLYCK